jgi:spore germination protein
VSGPVSAATKLRGGVSVWLPFWNMAAALSSAVTNAAVVGAASPFWYAISGDSAIQGNPGAGEEAVVRALHARGERVIPTVTESENLRAFDRMLASARRRARMVGALLAIARGQGYDGLDLDFEDFAVDPGHDAVLADRAAAGYPTLIAEVCGALHAIGKTCTVTIMPRTSGAKVYWRKRLATWVYDYGALAHLADRLRVMAYDEHAPGGAPGAISPYAWVERVIAYASSAMPADKVELALPAYGYDWSAGEAAPVTSRQAPEVAIEHRASVSFDAAQAEATFRYSSHGRRHTVWYADASSTYERARLARAAGFAGIDIWAAGGEDPAVWARLRPLFGR